MQTCLTAGIAVPKHDPAPQAAVIGAQTRHIGVVATKSTLGYSPFLLARLSATIDHIARGRFGWHIVTSGEDAAAPNFGLPTLPGHDLRSDFSEEFMRAVRTPTAPCGPAAGGIDRTTGT